MVEGAGSTWNVELRNGPGRTLEVEGEGRLALVDARPHLDCGNSGTDDATARRRARRGAVPECARPATRASPRRPMERIAEPLRADGRRGLAPPMATRRSRSRVRRFAGIDYATPVPQRPGEERGAPRGARRRRRDRRSPRPPPPAITPSGRSARSGRPVRIDADGSRACERFQHEGFDGQVPGDPSSAAFLVAAAALTGSAITHRPASGSTPAVCSSSRCSSGWGSRTRRADRRDEVGEPVGNGRGRARVAIGSARACRGRRAPARHRRGPRARPRRRARGGGFVVPRRRGAPREGERPAGGRSPAASAAWGATAADEGAGPRRRGGRSRGRPRGRGGRPPDGDGAGGRRAGGAIGPSRIDGIEAADVSFPGFVGRCARLGARSEASHDGPLRPSSRSTVPPAAASRRSPAASRGAGLPYVNTGLMYRALAAASLRAEVDADDAEASGRARARR